MPRAYRQLDLAERRTIFRLLNAKTPIAGIARELGRHRSTMQREIRRNHFPGPREYAGYYPAERPGPDQRAPKAAAQAVPKPGST